MRIRWQDDAIADLVQIRRFINLDNPAAAASIARRLRESVPLLQEFPASGRPGRVPGTRELIIPDLPYLIAYRIEVETVVVLRVLHTSRRWPDTLA